MLHPARRTSTIAMATAAALAVLAVAAFAVYGPQIVSYVSHLRGSPTHTDPYVPLAGDDTPQVRLAVAGDVGDGGSRLHRTVEAMARTAAGDPYDAVLLLGDNVYPDGEVALLDDRVFEPFAPLLSQGTELLAILGNHDVMRGEGDEMMTALDMPGRYWSRQLGELLIVGLDSTRPADPRQRAWLESTLDAATARWVVVAVHHPPYSSGYQGSSEDVRAAFSPIFERFAVDLVLSGHEHDYERTTPINGVTYVVTGAAADTRRTEKDSFTEVAVSWHHFVEIDVLEDRLLVRAVNQEGRVFDELTLR